MRKVIKGKRYDTNDAVPVGTYRFGAGLSRLSETLYRKQTPREYFIHGEGDRASRYAVDNNDGTFTEGGRIIPLTYEQAIAWADEFLSKKDYNAEFRATKKEGQPRERVNYKIDPEIRQALERRASMLKISMSDVVNEALDYYMSKTTN